MNLRRKIQFCSKEATMKIYAIFILILLVFAPLIHAKSVPDQYPDLQFEDSYSYGVVTEIGDNYVVLKNQIFTIYLRDLENIRDYDLLLRCSRLFKFSICLHVFSFESPEGTIHRELYTYSKPPAK